LCGHEHEHCNGPQASPQAQINSSTKMVLVIKFDEIAGADVAFRAGFGISRLKLLPVTGSLLPLIMCCNL
jgi:hypothetical protein